MQRWGTVLIWLAGALAILLTVALAAPHMSAIPAYRRQDSTELAYLLVYALLILGTSWASFRREGWKTLRHAVIWLVIGGLIALLYMATHR